MSYRAPVAAQAGDWEAIAWHFGLPGPAFLKRKAEEERKRKRKARKAKRKGRRSTERMRDE